MAKIGRDGRVPKRLDAAPPHGGMHFRQDGKLNPGVSRTQAAHPLDDSHQVHRPTVAKRLTPVEINPGTRSRHNDKLNGC
jgi:hypothetical protein